MSFDHIVRGGQARRSVPSKDLRGMELRSPRPRELVLTMVVTFSLTFAILMRGQETETLQPQAPASQTPEVARPESMPSRMAARPPELVEPVSPPADAARSRVSTAEAPAPGASPGATVLPLAFNIYNRHARGKIEGFIRNMSGQPMSVALQVVDAAGQPTAQAELNLAPAEQKGFGTDSGLDIHSRDRVILHSPPYQDGSMEVP